MFRCQEELRVAIVDPIFTNSCAQEMLELMSSLLERLDAEGVAQWTFSAGEVRDGSVYPVIWDRLLSGAAEVSQPQFCCPSGY